MKNLLDSTKVACVFLDTDLRVRRFTPTVTEIIPLTAADTGRPIKHLASTLINTDLTKYGQMVLKDLAVQETEVESEDNRNYVMRVRPYRTVGNVIDGVVITFEEFTKHKRTEQALSKSEQLYRSLFELASDSVALVDVDTRGFTEFNRNAYERLGYTEKEFERLTVPEIEAAQSADDVAKNLEKIVKQGSVVFETKHRRKDATSRDVLVRGKAVLIDGKTYILSSWHDLSPLSAREHSPR